LKPQISPKATTKFAKATFTKTLARSSAVWLGIAGLVFAVAAAPAEAGKRSKSRKPVTASLPDPANGQPTTLVISLGQQKIDVYRGTEKIGTSKVSSGMRGYGTRAGVFTILEKRRRHYSNLYGGAPMPWMQRLTWSGTALHGGVVPGYPASHGCVRLPFSFAPKLFQATGVGEHVVVARGRPEPTPIEHEKLFQPLPPPALPILANEPVKQRESSLSGSSLGGRRGLAAATHSLVILAKAEAPVPIRSEAALENYGHATADSAVTSNKVHAIGSADPGEQVHAIPNPTPVTRNLEPEQASEEQSSEDRAADLKPADDKSAIDPKPTVDLKPVDDKSAIVPEPTITAAPTSESPEEQRSEDKTADLKPTTDESVVDPEPTIVAAPTLEIPDASPARVRAANGPSAVSIAVNTGAGAAAIVAAEPRSEAPLRVLITRRTHRDRLVGLQRVLSSMDYLEPVNFDGTFGRATIRAIKAFQKANDMPETGAATDDLIKKVYAVAGKDEPPAGHLFVRQEFDAVFDTPVSFRHSDEPLGTHLYTVLKFRPGQTKADWVSFTVTPSELNPLDRIEIPADIRRKISQRLTPGSSLIIADTAINTATLKRGADFLVWAKDPPGTVKQASKSRRPVRRKRTRRKKRPSQTVRRYQHYDNSPTWFPRW
jgi:peptidoglycan hydrolase-like protein with peptidoglycan-binding domain